MLVPPSPKFQLHEVGEPVELSVNMTVSGATPEVGEPMKAATGAELWVQKVISYLVRSPVEGVLLQV